MPCSAVTLSLATISAICAAALMAIAFSTDNWLYIEVKRTNIQNLAAQHNDASSQVLLDNLNSKFFYFTRTKGLFRVCYPKERPPTVITYLSPVETHCNNVDYFIPDVNDETKGFSEDAMASALGEISTAPPNCNSIPYGEISPAPWADAQPHPTLTPLLPLIMNLALVRDFHNRLHMARSTVALFIVAFFTIFVAFWTGVVGCWKRSPGNITATAILMLTACLLSAGAMALWHGVEFYEKEKVVGEEYYQQWANALKDNTSIWYDWSYILAWLCVAVSFASSVFFFSAATCLGNEKQKEQQNNVQYIMPEQILRDNARIWYDWSYMVAWCGVGLSLVSAILFSSAAICLRGEREREEALNMQYLMPVYPQKQQYAYAGYPPPQAYPGPYYHGSQYGPYNY